MELATEETDMYQSSSPLIIFAIIMAGFTVSVVMSLGLALIAERSPRWADRLPRRSVVRTRPSIFSVPQQFTHQRSA